uniref:uncharacterized protein LOC118525330 n=1 Tax=Halichoerus grypus TaxID=9711 RepID=UPI001659897C|nr:uncharacterized protein LOC118525330 [Halichoerus grypus]
MRDLLPAAHTPVLPAGLASGASPSAPLSQSQPGVPETAQGVKPGASLFTKERNGFAHSVPSPSIPAVARTPGGLGLTGSRPGDHAGFLWERRWEAGAHLAPHPAPAHLSLYARDTRDFSPPSPMSAPPSATGFGANSRTIGKAGIGGSIVAAWLEISFDANWSLLRTSFNSPLTWVPWCPFDGRETPGEVTSSHSSEVAANTLNEARQGGTNVEPQHPWEPPA